MAQTATYTKQELGTIDGMTIRLAQVDGITQERDAELFAKGTEVEPFGWRCKWWICDAKDLAEIQAAARFYYGWNTGSEIIHHMNDGRIMYKAYYAC